MLLIISLPTDYWPFPKSESNGSLLTLPSQGNVLLEEQTTAH